MNKKLKAILAAGMVCLSMTASLPLTALAADGGYGAVIVDTQYKNVTIFTKAELEELSGKTLIARDVSPVYTQLGNAELWETAGYSKSHAAKIAALVKLNRSESQGILKGVANNSNLGFKVVIEMYNGRINVHMSKGSLNEASNGNSGNTGNTGNTGGTTTPTPAPGQEIRTIKEFDLQIEYAKKDIELEYNTSKITKAVYKNGLTGQNLKGEKVTAIYESCIEGVDFKASDKDIAAAILANLGADTTYKQFEMEIQFTDGIELEIELKK